MSFEKILLSSTTQKKCKLISGLGLGSGISEGSADDSKVHPAFGSTDLYILEKEDMQILSS